MTPRQRDILAHLVNGLTNGEIASLLVVAPGTVHNHVAMLLRRVGVDNRTSLAVWAVVRAGFTPSFGDAVAHELSSLQIGDPEGAV